MAIDKGTRTVKVTDHEGEPAYRIESAKGDEAGRVQISYERVSWTPPSVDPHELAEAALLAAGHEAHALKVAEMRKEMGA